MACGRADLQGLHGSPFSSRLGNQPYAQGSYFLTCGQTNVTCKVVKGKLVEVGKWPWQVSILFLGVYICSGSLVHQQWVLTAAHCLQRSKDPTQYSIKVGAEHRPNNGTQLPLSHIMIHEGFSNLVSQDIALLKLTDPVSWSPLVQPICLPTTNFKLTMGSLCWTIGWGYTEKKVTPKTPYSLQEVAVRIIHSDICNQQYQFLLSKDQKNFIGNDVLCAGLELGSDTCQDNSGSSLVCRVDGTWVQMGVVSWSFGCKRRQFPSAYTSTSYFSSWIKRHISDLQFASRAGPSFQSLALLPGCALLICLCSLWLL